MENVFIQHLGYIFTFLALSVKDVLWLRIILATAQITLGIYSFLEQRFDVLFWNGVFTSVNLYQDESTSFIMEEYFPLVIYKAQKT